MKDLGERSLPQISDFSKHLMLLIIAVFAMMTPLLFNSNNFNVRILLYLTIMIVFVGLYFGHKVLTTIIELYLNPDYEKIDFHKVKPVINALRRQFLFSILSVVCLVATYGFHVVSIQNIDNERFKELSQRILAIESKMTTFEIIEDKLNHIKTEVSGNEKEIMALLSKMLLNESELHSIRLEQNKIVNKQKIIQQNIKKQNK